jgi:NAD(P)-dependent dehydrogenase (short-subunit alcohol dehydrogenase family)
MHADQLFNLTRHVAIVTGGSRGLGLEMAAALGEAGATVVVTARRQQWLSSAEQRLSKAGITCLALQCDGSQPEQVLQVVARVVHQFGRIDVLVNNAGISWAEPLETMPVEKWREVFETNATGCFLMSRAVGLEMIRAGTSGSMINIASVMGLVGMAPEIIDAAGYSASKGAVISFTRDMAVKWARHGIRVNAIAPGFFETRLSTGVLKRSQSEIERITPMARIGLPGEMKGAVVFLASRASSYVTGQVLSVDGGATAW